MTCGCRIRAPIQSMFISGPSQPCERDRWLCRRCARRPPPRATVPATAAFARAWTPARASWSCLHSCTPLPSQCAERPSAQPVQDSLYALTVVLLSSETVRSQSPPPLCSDRACIADPCACMHMQNVAVAATATAMAINSVAQAAHCHAQPLAASLLVTCCAVGACICFPCPPAHAGCLSTATASDPPRHRARRIIGVWKPARVPPARSLHAASNGSRLVSVHRR